MKYALLIFDDETKSDMTPETFARWGAYDELLVLSANELEEVLS